MNTPKSAKTKDSAHSQSASRSWLYPVIILAVVLAGIGWWRLRSGSAGASNERKVAFYQDSMHPWVKSDRPGKCTICAMELTPIYEGDQGFGGQENVVALSSNSITVLNVQTEEVKRQPLRRTLRVAGTLEANESRKSIVAAPAPGRVEKLFVEYAGVEVEEGQALITFYSPDLLTYKRRYLLRQRTTRAGQFNDMMQDVAPGTPTETVRPVNESYSDAMKGRQEVDPFYNDLISPLSGTVIERNAFLGQYVAEGDRLFTIVDSSVLWFRFDVYEQQLPWLSLGQKVAVSVPAVPGKTFMAVVTFIEPTVNDATRTVKVRADVANPFVSETGPKRRLLSYGMYADGVVQAGVPNALTVPREAILMPGLRAYAYVEKSAGVYERRRVKLGRQGDNRWEIQEGLDEGDRVVVTGNVLIDAQAQFSQSVSEDEMDEEMDHNAMEATAAEPEPKLSEPQLKALENFLAVANGISVALAADNLKQVKEHAGHLPDTASQLLKAFEQDHRWSELIRRIETASHWATPADLDAARTNFLPFSTNVVALVEDLRGSLTTFQSLKVFQCPMAPKPGLWFQAKGPLRNPYFGAEMLTCGTEVRLTRKPKPAPQPEVVVASPNIEMPSAHVMPVSHVATPAEVMSKPARTPGQDRNGASINSRLETMRQAAAGTNTTPSRGKLEGSQRAVIDQLLAITHGINQALASDDISQYNQQVAKLSPVLAGIQREFPPPHTWSGVIRQIAMRGQLSAVKDLAEARRLFAGFSTSTVDLGKLLRKAEPAYAGLKFYHCPMAPKPGVWLQTEGTLRNPFFGSKMLTCGEEISL